MWWALLTWGEGRPPPQGGGGGGRWCASSDRSWPSRHLRAARVGVWSCFSPLSFVDCWIDLMRAACSYQDIWWPVRCARTFTAGSPRGPSGVARAGVLWRGLRPLVLSLRCCADSWDLSVWWARCWRRSWRWRCPAGCGEFPVPGMTEPVVDAVLGGHEQAGMRRRACDLSAVGSAAPALSRDRLLRSVRWGLDVAG